MQAAARFERGESISQVARALRVSVRQVEKWRSTWRTGGIEALRSKGPASPPRLTGEQFARLDSELRRGPAAHGWDVDQRWTLARIVTVTERLFGVSYTLSGMSVLLRRNGWSVQVLREAGRRTRRDGHPGMDGGGVAAGENHCVGSAGLGVLRGRSGPGAQTAEGTHLGPGVGIPRWSGSVVGAAAG